MERTFTNGVRTEVARTPADVVKLRFDGWVECEAASPEAEDETETHPDDESVDPATKAGEDEQPHGTTDDQ